MWTVLFVPEAARERLILPPWERSALLHAVEKLEVFGPTLGYPHSSSVRGQPGLRELRPRAGRSPWRVFYARVGDVFIVASVGPEAKHDRRGFAMAVRRAQARLMAIEED